MLTIQFDQRRDDLTTLSQLTGVANGLRKCKKCIVVTGAGVSVSAGIPDFRSANGLYDLVKERFPKLVVKGKDLFDAAVFRQEDTTAMFYTFIGEIATLTAEAKPTPVHHFIRTLDDQGRLQRVYTQNIDSLEAQCGMNCDLPTAPIKTRAKAVKKEPTGRFHCPTPPPSQQPEAPTPTKKVDGLPKVVQLHGSLHQVKCLLCHEQSPCTAEHITAFKKAEMMDCQTCLTVSEAREAAGKRALGVGQIRPNIILYNEHHPQGDRIGELCALDVKKKPDYMLIMGTSLKVVGIKRLIKDFAKTIKVQRGAKIVLVNKTPLQNVSEWKDIIDYQIIAEGDAFTQFVETEWTRMQKIEDGRRQKKLAKQEKASKENVATNGSPHGGDIRPLLQKWTPSTATAIKPTSPLAVEPTSPLSIPSSLPVKSPVQVAPPPKVAAKVALPTQAKLSMPARKSRATMPVTVPLKEKTTSSSPRRSGRRPSVPPKSEASGDEEEAVPQSRLPLLVRPH